MEKNGFNGLDAVVPAPLGVPRPGVSRVEDCGVVAMEQAGDRRQAQIWAQIHGKSYCMKARWDQIVIAPGSKQLVPADLVDGTDGMDDRVHRDADLVHLDLRIIIVD